MNKRSTTSIAGRPPELPHERDESARTPQEDTQEDTRAVARQGHEDLKRGVQDTSRKVEADKAYEMQKGQGAAGTAPAAPDRSGAGQHKTDAGQGPGERRHASAELPPKRSR